MYHPFWGYKKGLRLSIQPVKNRQVSSKIVDYQKSCMEMANHPGIVLETHVPTPSPDVVDDTASKTQSALFHIYCKRNWTRYEMSSYQKHPQDSQGEYWLLFPACKQVLNENTIALSIEFA